MLSIRISFRYYSKGQKGGSSGKWATVWEVSGRESRVVLVRKIGLKVQRAEHFLLRSTDLEHSGQAAQAYRPANRVAIRCHVEGGAAGLTT